MDFKVEAIKEAEKSECSKRKVGAVIVKDGGIIARGYNYSPKQGGCEDVNGYTYNHVIHAEDAAIRKLLGGGADTIYVTHPPCDNCKELIKNANIKETIIVEKFIKFDSGKLRYNLIPPVIPRALATVFTYGAKKYKPNNWKLVDDVDRYWDALYRHLEARRDGEMFDKESKLPHLWHAITNIGFILFFDNQNNGDSNDDNTRSS